MKTNFFLSSVVLLGSLFLIACGGPKDVDKIAEAQNCLDHAATSEVADCVSKVDGMESESAYLIRCVGKFAKEGFNDTTKIANALSSVKGTDTGSNGSLSMMAALAFKSENSSALNSASASEALEFCTKAKSKGLILLSGLSKTSTAVAAIGGKDLASLNPDDLKQAMIDKQNDPEAQAAVGTAVTAIYQSNCTNNSTATGNFCQQFESAITTIPTGLDDPKKLGEQIMICFTAADPHNTPGCSGF